MSTKPITSIPIASYQPLSASFLFLECRKIEERIFQKMFDWDQSKVIATDEVAFSADSSIVSFEVGDCITIFGIENKEGVITKISGYHFAQLTNEEEMLEEYFDDFDKDNPPSFFVIGGNEHTTTDENCILDVMYTTIARYFGSQDCIKGRLLNIHGDYTFITAGLNLEGQLFYYQHN